MATDKTSIHSGLSCGESDCIATESILKQVQQPCSQLKGETVEYHPLSRTSSNSSTSSLENDDANSSPTERRRPFRKGRVSSVGRFREFLAKSDDQSESLDGNSYLNIWQNKSKILSNLKKQATESVRSLTQSASQESGFNQGFFYKSYEDSSESSQNTKPPASLSSKPSGLLKVATDDITESQQDSDVTTYLQGQDKELDPLTILKQKDEEDKQREDFFDEPVTFPRGRSLTSSAVSTTKEMKKRSELPPRPRRPPPITASSKKNLLAVSLSSLMAAKQDAIEDETNKDEKLKPMQEMEDRKEITRTKSNDSDSIVSPKPKESDPIVSEPPSLALMLISSFVVYLYLTLPLPPFVHIASSYFVLGCIFTAALLCYVAPRSRRLQPFLSYSINSHQPHSLPLSIYDPDQPIRGWMNEITAYDPDTYHISNTTSVFVTLDGATLRLQTPNKSIPRRSVYNEGSIPVSNVVHQRIHDITFSKVYLRPPGLVKKRVWSKKYPICVEILSGKPSDCNKDASEDSKDQINEDNSCRDAKFIYLFGRTDRQKEEWFYRIQRCINIAFIKHKRSQKAAQAKQLEAQASTDLAEDWGIIDDHYEEETYVASSLCDITKPNDQPIKLLQDYFVHISRLFPQPKSTVGSPHLSSPATSEKAADDLTEERQVSWLNVVLGRVVFDFLRQPLWTKWISVKVQRKLDKIKLPYFMDELKLTEMNLGSSVPLFHEISLPKLDAQGIWIDTEVTYSGTVQMTLKTKLVLTKLGKKETLLVERDSANRSNAITDSDAEDSAESSDEDAESTVSRLVGHVQHAVSKLDGQQIFKDAIKAVGKDPLPNDTPTTPYTSPSVDSSQPPAAGAPPKKWIRFVDSIAKNKYFKRATETEYIRKKLETVSNTPMLLTVELVQLKGILVINIPPPPTDRIWYGFREPPLMLLKAHPKVGERVVKTTHVTDWIESKLQQEVVKFLVMPNMDDIPIPIMFHNRQDPL